MTLEAILSGLSRSEKLDVMDLLWRDLTEDPSQFPSPLWHGEVLAERLNNPEDGNRLELADAMNDVKERLNARRTKE